VKFHQENAIHQENYSSNRVYIFKQDCYIIK